MPTPLEQNTATLEAILEAVNNLPDAGSGGSGGVETCTVSINTAGSNVSLAWSAVDSDGKVQYRAELVNLPITIYCVQGSTITFMGPTFVEALTNVTKVLEVNRGKVYRLAEGATTAIIASA